MSNHALAVSPEAPFAGPACYAPDYEGFLQILSDLGIHYRKNLHTRKREVDLGNGWETFNSVSKALLMSKAGEFKMLDARGNLVPWKMRKTLANACFREMDERFASHPLKEQLTAELEASDLGGEPLTAKEALEALGHENPSQSMKNLMGRILGEKWRPTKEGPEDCRYKAYVNDVPVDEFEGEIAEKQLPDLSKGRAYGLVERIWRDSLSPAEGVSVFFSKADRGYLSDIERYLSNEGLDAGDFHGWLFGKWGEGLGLRLGKMIGRSPDAVPEIPKPVFMTACLNEAVSFYLADKEQGQ